jgi:hypothetical protein
MFAPTCCDTLIAVALPPWPTMSDVRSGAPFRTTPRSRTRSVEPPLTTTGVLPMSSIDFHSADTITRCCWPFCG